MKFTGLNDSQVLESRRLHGSNALTELPPVPLWKRLLQGFANPMIMILLVALLVQLLLFAFGKAEWYEPLGVFLAIMLANGVAAVFEHKQDAKARALKAQANSRETVKLVRNDQFLELPVDQVVQGDVCFLQAGDKVPADGILLQGSLKLDQSSLNGESEEATKETCPQGAEYNVKDLLNPYYIYRGTVVCGGEALMQVMVVGDGTEFGQAALALQEETRETPLQVKLAKLAGHITVFGYIGAAAIVLIVLGVTALRGEAPDNWQDWLKLALNAVTVAVTIIVCAVPEGLPMLSSILQALQSLKMVKDNVLVRKISGLETAGSLSIIFSDKTGTITEGRLSVVELATANLHCMAKLEQLQGDFLEDLVNGIGINNSALPGRDGVIGGNNTDRALMAYLMTTGLHKGISRKDVIEMNAFDSSKKYSSVLMQRNGEKLMYFKGAPEKLIEKCSFYEDESGKVSPWKDKSALMEYIDRQAGRSMRMLAVAKSAEGRNILLCVISIRDNVRGQVKYAVKEIQDAGIQVVMVTGDRQETAVAIAREAGLVCSPEDLAMTSFELTEKSDAELKALLPRLKVVSRALPLDKSRLVRLAQELDMVVGMTGDGVNDSPALRKADVGFAMGSGTDVAKAAGDITILDDNLSSIEKAILYGRSMFKSIRKFLIFQLTVNVAAVLICAIGPVFGYNVVMTVIQLLLINLAMDTLAAIAFGSEPPLQEFMREKPIPRREDILTRKMLAEVLLSAAYITLLCLAMLLLPPVQNFLFGAPVDKMNITSAVFATFMMAITFNGFNARTEHINPFEKIGRNLTFLGIMLGLLICQYLFVTFGGKALSVTPLSCGTWLKCLVLAFCVIPLDMLRKLFVTTRGR